MNYFNFKISAKRGEFYQSSKTPREGFEEVIYQEVKKTYHKYQRTLFGVVHSVASKEFIYEGKTIKLLEVSLKDGDNLYQISTQLKNTRGNYSDEAKALISALDGYQAGEPVTISLAYKSSQGKDGKTYNNCNVYINYQNILNDAGKGQSTGFIPYDQIPKPEKKEVAGEVVYNHEAQLVFFFEKLQVLSSKFKAAEQAPRQETTAPTPAPVASAAQQSVSTPIATPTSMGDDNLPF